MYECAVAVLDAVVIESLNFYAKRDDEFAKSIKSIKIIKNEQLRANKLENGKGKYK